MTNRRQNPGEVPTTSNRAYVAALIAGACTAIVGWWAGVMWL